jgi:hypothetical protein
VQPSGAETPTKGKRGIIGKLKTDMIRRTHDEPKLVNPSGWISEGDVLPIRKDSSTQSPPAEVRHLAFADRLPTATSEERGEDLVQLTRAPTRPRRRLSDPGFLVEPSASRAGESPHLPCNIVDIGFSSDEALPDGREPQRRRR